MLRWYVEVDYKPKKHVEMNQSWKSVFCEIDYNFPEGNSLRTALKIKGELILAIPESVDVIETLDVMTAAKSVGERCDFWKTTLATVLVLDMEGKRDIIPEVFLALTSTLKEQGDVSL